MDADLVDLYVYNDDEDRIILPPTQVRGKRKSKAPTEIRKDDTVHQLLRGDVLLRHPYYIADAVNESIYISRYSQKNSDNIKKNKKFIEREGIVSTAIVPLVVVEKVVGILFINYKTLQPFLDHQRS